MADIDRIAVLAVLFLVSMAYNEAIAWITEEAGGLLPIPPLWIAFGVIYTLIAAYIIDGFTPPDPEPAGWIRWDTLIECFVFAGSPLIWGSLRRFIDNTQSSRARRRRSPGDRRREGPE